MKTKVVYVVCSDERDYYLEQALLSLFSLRNHNPAAYVEIVVDAKTDNTITDTRAEVLKYIDAKTIVTVPEPYDKRLSSRFIKTSLRQHVKGDFLFIDTDTIVCGDLSEIDKFEGELGAVINIHVPISMYNKNYQKTIRKHAQQEGWKCSDEIPFYNSGVFYVKDTDLTHRFYDCWHKNWIKTLHAYNRHYDQPPLAFANENYDYIIKELPGIWNCQIRKSALPYLHDAKIIHYFYSTTQGNNNAYVFCDHTLFQGVRENGITKETSTLIDNAKSAFSHPTRICGPCEINLLSGEMAQVCLYHPGIAKVLNMLFHLLIIIKTPFSRLKAAIVSANNSNLASR